MTITKILIVDDDTISLEMHQRTLCHEFNIHTAESGEESLAILAEQGPFAVVMTDLHLDGMSGMDLLRRMKEAHGETVRIMHTSDDHQAIAAEAVNNGQIFRFLKKPCPPGELAKAIRAGVIQYHSVIAEKKLLDNTLSGSIDILVEILSKVKPLAFGRGMRAQSLVMKLCNRLHVERSWEISIAALLSQIGCVSMPDSVVEKAYRGDRLSTDEAKLYASHPKLGYDCVSKLPRMNRIAEIIVRQQIPYCDTSQTNEAPDLHDLAMRGNLLRTAIDYEMHIEQGHSAEQALREMQHNSSEYDSNLLRALEQVAGAGHVDEFRKVSLNELREGMVLGEEIADEAGIVLITKGHEITRGHISLLRNQKADGRFIRKPIRVLRDAGEVTIQIG